MAGYWRGICPAVDCDRLMMCGVWDKIKEYHLSLSTMDVVKGD
jgi:hypothetical protein